MSNKKEKLIVFVSVLSLLIVIIGVSVAYFTIDVTGNDEASTITVIMGEEKVDYDGDQK